MNTVLIAFQIITATGNFSGQIDKVCPGAYCQYLTVHDGLVGFIDSTPPSRILVIGKYLAADQNLVPRIEAPIREIQSAHGWRMVVSAMLDHDEGGTKLRLRFFGPDGVQRGSDDLYSVLEQADVGYLFGGNDEILAITSNEEHAYNTQTEIWLLPEHGGPKRLLSFPGVYEKFISGVSGQMAGVRVGRETYDGVHAETKGRAQEFWAWDSKAKSLTQLAQAIESQLGL